MKKSRSFRNKLLLSILAIISITLMIGTILIVSLVKKELFEQNERYTLSAFVKTETELDNKQDRIENDYVSLSSALTNTGILRNDISDYLNYTKSLIQVSRIFDQYLDYDLIGLVSEDMAIVSSPSRSFSVHTKTEALFHSPLYTQLVEKRPRYGTAYLYEFTGIADTEKFPQSFRQSRILYFTKSFVSDQKTYTLVLGMKEDVLHQMYLHLEQGSNSIYVVNRDGIILSSSNREQFQSQLSYFTNPENRQQSYKMQLNDVEYQIIQYPLHTFDWTIVNQYPTMEYMRDVNRMSYLIVVIFLCCLLAVGAAVTIIIRRLSRPLDDLSHRLQNFSSTGLSSAIQPPKKTDINEFEILNSSFCKMAADIQKLVAMQKAEEEKKNQLRIQALMAQINPHFICNALNTVKVMADISGAQNVATMIQHICQYISPAFRTNKNRWTYAEEYSFLLDYVYILEIRFNARLEIECQFDPSIQEETLPRFLIQPLIENSVFHGMNRESILKISVSVQKTEGQWVQILVSDNGIGFTPEQLQKERQVLLHFEEDAPVKVSTGIGLQNIKQRLNSYYPGRHTFEIESIPDQETTIKIQIPLFHNETASSAKSLENSQ